MAENMGADIAEDDFFRGDEAENGQSGSMTMEHLIGREFNMVKVG